jgi:hypothetical protein
MVPDCRGGLRQLLEVPIEARAQRMTLRTVGSGAREHDEIPRRQCVLMAKGLASDALEFVAIHGASRSSAGNGQTEPRAGTATGAGENGEEAIARARGFGEYSPELRSCVQSLAGREP